MLRIAANLIAVLSIYLIPWWVFLVLTISFALYFNKFYEGIAYAFVFDVVYRSSSGIEQFYGFKVTFLTAILVSSLEYSKKYIRFY